MDDLPLELLPLGFESLVGDGQACRSVEPEELGAALADLHGTVDGEEAALGNLGGDGGEIGVQTGDLNSPVLGHVLLPPAFQARRESLLGAPFRLVAEA